MICNTGNRGLRVITFGEHTCDFGHPTSLILATSNTCTRKYKEKKSVSFEFAGAREDWWEEKTSNYPWCYHNDGTFWKANWDFCLRQLYFLKQLFNNKLLNITRFVSFGKGFISNMFVFDYRFYCLELKSFILSRLEIF